MTGNVDPVLCPDGRASLRAYEALRPQAPHVLGLGRTVTRQQVWDAMCADREQLGATNDPLLSAYQLARVAYGWRFTHEPLDEDGLPLPCP